MPRHALPTGRGEVFHVGGCPGSPGVPKHSVFSVFVASLAACARDLTNSRLVLLITSFASVGVAAGGAGGDGAMGGVGGLGGVTEGDSAGCDTGRDTACTNSLMIVRRFGLVVASKVGAEHAVLVKLIV